MHNGVEAINNRASPSGLSDMFRLYVLQKPGKEPVDTGKDNPALIET